MIKSGTIDIDVSARSTTGSDKNKQRDNGIAIAATENSMSAASSEPIDFTFPSIYSIIVSTSENGIYNFFKVYLTVSVLIVISVRLNVYYI